MQVFRNLARLGKTKQHFTCSLRYTHSNNTKENGHSHTDSTYSDDIMGNNSNKSKEQNNKSNEDGTSEQQQQPVRELSEEEIARFKEEHAQLEARQAKLKEQQKELAEKLEKYRPKYSGSIYELSNAQKFVEEQIRKFDWNSYVISKYYPASVRNAFFAFNFYNIELMRIPENSKEASLILGKLDFWQESIESIYRDSPMKEPVSVCLHDACKNNPISKATMLKLIQARRFEAEHPRLNSIQEMSYLAEQVRTNMIYLNLQLLRIDYKNNSPLNQAVLLVGRSLGIIDYIKRIPYNLQKYRLYMPDDINRKHNISVRNLWDRVLGKPKDELFDVVLEVASYAKQSLDASRELQGQLPPQAFRALLHAVEAEQYLKDLERVNFNVFDTSLNSNSYVQLPIHLFQAAKNKKYLYYEK